jgi:hypothetical protein
MTGENNILLIIDIREISPTIELPFLLTITISPPNNQPQTPIVIVASNPNSSD